MARKLRATEGMQPNRRVSEVKPSPSWRRRPSRLERLLSDLSALSARSESVRFSDVARHSSSVLTQPKNQVDQSSETDTYDDVTRSWDNQKIRRRLNTCCSLGWSLIQESKQVTGVDFLDNSNLVNSSLSSRNINYILSFSSYLISLILRHSKIKSLPFVFHQRFEIYIHSFSFA